VVSYSGRFAPAVAVPLASWKGGEPATELTSSGSNTTNGDATRESWAIYRASRAIHDETLRALQVMLDEARSRRDVR